jgi:hypothetical protein
MYITPSGDDIASANNTGFADNIDILAGDTPCAAKIDSAVLKGLSRFSEASSNSGALTGVGRPVLKGFVLATFAPAEEEEANWTEI